MSAFDSDAITVAGADDAGWRAEQRSRAAASYDDAGMPDSAEEIWRYIELGFELDDYSPALSPGEPLGDDPLDGVTDNVVAARLVDGHWFGEDHEAGEVTVASLRRSSTVKPELVESVIAETGLAALEDKFALAATAFGSDGAFVHVPTGTVSPGVVYLDVQATEAGTVSFPRIVITVDDGAEASVVVHLRSRKDDDLIVVPQLAAAIGTNANLAVTVVQNLGYATRSIGNAPLCRGRARRQAGPAAPRREHAGNRIGRRRRRRLLR